MGPGAFFGEKNFRGDMQVSWPASMVARGKVSTPATCRRVQLVAAGQSAQTRFARAGHAVTSAARGKISMNRMQAAAS